MMYRLEELNELSGKYAAAYNKQVFQPYFIKEAERVGANKDEYKNKLRADWFYALSFLLNRTFFQGRNDELSLIYLKGAISVLQEQLNSGDTQKLLQIKPEDLENRLKEDGVDKNTDRQMVIGAINFIRKNLGQYGYSIVDYVLSYVEQGRSLREVYNKITKIKGINDKTATFFFRELMFVLEKSVGADDRIFLQPIDTYVREYAKNSGMVSDFLSYNYIPSTELKHGLAIKNDIDFYVKRAIVYFSQEANVSSIKANQGIWAKESKRVRI